jgi:hypothetical protein
MNGRSVIPVLLLLFLVGSAGTMEGHAAQRKSSPDAGTYPDKPIRFITA